MLAGAGQPEQARRALEQALEAARSIKDQFGRDDTLLQGAAVAEIAEALARAGHAEQALAAARSIAYASDRTKALQEAGKALAGAGYAEQAQEAARSIPVAASRRLGPCRRSQRR